MQIFLILSSTFFRLAQKSSASNEVFIIDSVVLTMKQDKYILTSRYLDKVLETNSNAHRNKPVPSSLAQTATMFPPGKELASVTNDIAHKMGQILNQYPRLYFLAMLMLNNGLRVSEALAIEPTDITKLGHIAIRAKKGSKDRMIHAGLCLQFVLRCREDRIKPFDLMTRSHVYKQFKKYGIGIQLSGRKNRSVTHALRHLASKAIKESELDIRFSQQLLGHRSQNSTKYYHE